MIVVVCLPCALAIRVLPARSAEALSNEELELLVGRKSEFWPDKYPCPRCEKPATGMREHEADPRVLLTIGIHDLTPQEAFAAFNGLGFPEEQSCTLPELQELLRAQPIRRVVGSNIPQSGRVVVDALELWDGTTVHLGAAVEGAIVYRIVRPQSYAAKLMEGAAP